MQTGFHHVAAEWAAERPESLPLGTKTLELHPELQEAGYEVKTIAGKAGDLLIWDYFREAHPLPHLPPRANAMYLRVRDCCQRSCRSRVSRRRSE